MPEKPKKPLTLPEVLEKHQYKTGVRDLAAHCWCGWKVPTVNTNKTKVQLHREHIAEMYREARTIRTSQAAEALQDWVVVKEDPEHGDGRILTRDRYFKSGWDSHDERDHLGVDPPELPALVLHTLRDEASR